MDERLRENPLAYKDNNMVYRLSKEEIDSSIKNVKKEK